MSVIYYRFKSGIQTETVKFDDVQISVGELRTLVMQKERMAKGGDYDLQILNAQTSRVYDKNEEMIPRNSTVVVSRVPRIGGSSKRRETDEDSKVRKTSLAGRARQRVRGGAAWHNLAGRGVSEWATASTPPAPPLYSQSSVRAR